MTLGFCSTMVLIVAGRRSKQASSVLLMESCAALVSSAMGITRIRSGCGSGMNPVLAAHQSSRRSRNFCVLVK